MSTFITIFIIAFVVGATISKPIIFGVKKLNASQTILHYVKEHKAKDGTPTMGGFIFILASLVCIFWFFDTNAILAVLAICLMFVYGLLGFLDDYIKIKHKQNKGLRAYQKVIYQFLVGLLIGIFCYVGPFNLTQLYVPFTTILIDIGVYIIPFVVFVYIAMVNAVNLIDGLDGLCSGVSFVVIMAFAALILYYTPLYNGSGILEQLSLVKLCFALSGGILAYYIFNCFPAKIFMGDTGSLALGGAITCIAVFSKLTLYLPLVGIMYVLTVVSDVVQVVYFRKTKKRIFLMAPLHHHFQMKGVNENRIVTIYICITLCVSLAVIAITLFVGG